MCFFKFLNALFLYIFSILIPFKPLNFIILIIKTPSPKSEFFQIIFELLKR
jgi:hypothetical protein